MTAIQLETVAAPAPFGLEGRGPQLAWWIHDTDLRLPDSDESPTPAAGHLRGLQVADDPEQTAWVLFHGLQVIQVVPEEVHAYWHTELAAPGRAGHSPWRIVDSPWLETFAPHHLDGLSHFLIELYDEIVEVICTDLIFGAGVFDLAAVLPDEPRLAEAYLLRAQSLECLGRADEARAEFERYAAASPDRARADYARRCAQTIATRQRLRPALDAGGGSTVLEDALRVDGWACLRAALWDLLRDDTAAGHWRVAAEALLAGVRRGEDVGGEEDLIALLFYRFDPTGEAGDPLVLEITRRLLNLADDFPYDPFRDRAVSREMRRLRALRNAPEA